MEFSQDMITDIEEYKQCAQQHNTYIGASTLQDTITCDSSTFIDECSAMSEQIDRMLKLLKEKRGKNYKPHITNIELTDYLHTCENDCCIDYGTEVHIEGKHIADVPANSPESLLEIVLKHFGIEATVSRSYEEGESGCYETSCKLDKEE